MSDSHSLAFDYHNPMLSLDNQNRKLRKEGYRRKLYHGSILALHVLNYACMGKDGYLKKVKEALEELEKRGLVKKVYWDGKEKEWAYVITSKGKKVLERVKKLIEKEKTNYIV